MMVTETETLGSTLHHNEFTYLDYVFSATFILSDFDPYLLLYIYIYIYIYMFVSPTVSYEGQPFMKRNVHMLTTLTQATLSFGRRIHSISFHPTLLNLLRQSVCLVPSNLIAKWGSKFVHFFRFFKNQFCFFCNRVDFLKTGSSFYLIIYISS